MNNIYLLSDVVCSTIAVIPEFKRKKNFLYLFVSKRKDLLGGYTRPDSEIASIRSIMLYIL